MVFYFSGTGNDLAAANILKCCDEVFDIADCLRRGQSSFSPASDEPVIIVAPIFFGGLPTVVEEFLASFRLLTAPAGLYGVLTYGGGAFDAPLILRDALAPCLAPVTAIYTVVMPANFCVLYPIASDEAIEATLAKSNEQLRAIRAAIRDGAPSPKREDLSRPMTGESRKGRAVYDEMRKTSHFHVADSCVHCGVCASRCPTGALVMKDDNPTWVKDECSLCMACMRCGAILYDDKITGARRYVHPDLKKKKTEQDAPCC